MAPKRRSASRGRAAKKMRETQPIDIVTAAIKSPAVPLDLQALLTHALPLVLSAPKVDRHAYETEIVAAAQQALTTAHTACKEAHKDALAKQAVIIAPKERTDRTAAEQVAVAESIAAKGNWDGKKEVQKAAEQAVSAAEAAAKTAKKEATQAEKLAQSAEQQKTELEGILSTELAMLLAGTSASSAGKKAVQTLAKIGKQCGVGPTLMHAFPLACKKEPSSRSDFEASTLETLKSKVTGKIAALEAECQAHTATAEGKKAAAAEADKQLGTTTTALDEATAATASAHEAYKAAVKAATKAGQHVANIWDDMRKVCEAQDQLAKDLKNFEDTIFPTFEALKEKVEEPEPVEEEAAAEPATEEAAAEPAAEAAAPMAVEEAPQV